MARGKWFLAALSVVLIGLAVGAVSLRRRESAAQSAVVRTSATSLPEPGEIRLPVKIRPRHIVPVSSPAQGMIDAVFADVGDEVYEGQLLVQISDHVLVEARNAARTAAENARARAAQLEASLLTAHLDASRARADADRAKAESERAGKFHQRQKMLHGEGATPRLVYEKAEREAADAAGEFDSLDVLARQAETRVSDINAELRSIRRLAVERALEIEQADSQLKGGDVYSPVDGLIMTRRCEVGKAVAEGTSADLFDIAVNLEELEAVLEAEPSALARLDPGQQAILFFADVPGEGIPGKLREVSGGEAVFEFTSPTPVIRPGMTAQIRVRLR